MIMYQLPAGLEQLQAVDRRHGNGLLQCTSKGIATIEATEALPQ